MSGLLEARSTPPAATFAARLADKARRLAEARAEERRLAEANDPWRWRKAPLLWPLFAKD
jgi:hypothetical protein